MQKPRAVVCWSGGKDSALALYRILQEGRFEVVALLTTLNADSRRTNMHLVCEELLDEQAAALGIPLEKAWVSDGSNREYEQVMGEKLLAQKSLGVTHVVFGDIFLQDLRLYREQLLQGLGLEGVFPLWEQDTGSLIREFLQAGFKTIVCCVSTAFFSENSVGEELDAGFIDRLPAEADPCGENGEFHTFCYQGPLFQKPVLFQKGRKNSALLRGGSIQAGFWFIDLLPVGNR